MVRRDSARPVIILIAGVPGSGKTTLARALNNALGLPFVSRDELKAGLYASRRDPATPPLESELPRRAVTLFYEIVAYLVRAGASVLAESTFVRHLSEPDIEGLRRHADLAVVQIDVEPDVAIARVRARTETDVTDRAAHDDAGWLARIEQEGLRPATYELSIAPDLLISVTNDYTFDPPAAKIAEELATYLQRRE